MSWREQPRLIGGEVQLPPPHGVQAGRLIAFNGMGADGTPDAGTPTAGGTIAGVAEQGGTLCGVPAVPGAAVKIEAGGAFTAGALLASDGLGRVVLATTGQTIVAKAMQNASGAGQVIWCTFETQRTR